MYIIVFILFGTVLVVGYWLLYPYKVIQFNKVPFPVVNKIVHQGGILTYQTDYCKFNNIIPVSYKTFTDGIIYHIPSSYVLAKNKGCAKTFIDIEVPRTLPVGNYVLDILYIYQVNPIRTVNVDVKTENFEVVK